MMNKRMSRREMLRLGGLGVSALALAACGGQNTMPSGSMSPFTPQPNVGLTPSSEGLQPTKGFQALPANSRLIVGENRVALGLLQDGKSIKDAKVHMKFFDLSSGQPMLKNEADAPYYGDNLGEAGVYVAHTTFDKAGSWGAEVSAEQAGQPAQVARIALRVVADDPVPGVGQPAPKSKTPVLADVGGDRRKICSATEDDRTLHTITIADAVTSGKPSVILFATPAFCTSRTCGPSLQVIEGIAANYQDRVNFIHVEIYKEFEKFELADAVKEWHLESEPWLFFVDKDGKIVQRFEGGITSREIVPEFTNFIGV